MLAKVGREIGPHLRRGQLVLSVLAGATTAALTGFLGHDQVVRSMPDNTPARGLGTSWPRRRCGPISRPTLASI